MYQDVGRRMLMQKSPAGDSKEDFCLDLWSQLQRTVRKRGVICWPLKEKEQKKGKTLIWLYYFMPDVLNRKKYFD